MADKTPVKITIATSDIMGKEFASTIPTAPSNQRPDGNLPPPADVHPKEYSGGAGVDYRPPKANKAKGR